MKQLAFLTAVILLLPLAVVAQDNTPNLEDTVSYINSHLKKFGLAPRWPCDVKGDEDARSGQITLSEDHRTVIHVVHECHSTYIGRIPVAAVKSIHSDSIGGTTIVFLSCTDKDECAEILTKNSGNASAFRSAHVQVEISPNEEIGKRLSRAFEHLLELLRGEASRQLDPNDPFASAPPEGVPERRNIYRPRHSVLVGHPK